MHKILLLLVVLFGIQLFAQEPVVSSIEIEGLKRTKESFLRRLIKVKEGSVYDDVKVATDVERLNRLAGIANATSTLTKNSETDLSLIHI